MTIGHVLWDIRHHFSSGYSLQDSFSRMGTITIGITAFGQPFTE